MAPPAPAHEPGRGDSRRGALRGLIVAVALIVLGPVLVHVLGTAGRLQDCVMSGRANCAPLASAPAERP